MSSHQAISTLIATYAELVDAGNFEGVADLLSNATFVGSTPITGRDQILQYFKDTLILYADGTPRTKHLVTNSIIEVDEQAGTATARSYFTVLQATPDLPLQPIAAGHYTDRFARTPTTPWHFTHRQASVDLPGNLTHHLHPKPQ